MIRSSADRSSVALDLDLPAEVLATITPDPAFAEVVSARAAFDAAQDALDVATDALAAVDDLEADARRKAAEAGAKGAPPPKPLDPAYVEAMRSARRRGQARANAATVQAARRYRATLLAHRDPLRDVMVGTLFAAHDNAVRLQQQAQAADARQRSLASAIRSLDHATAFDSGQTPGEGSLLGNGVGHHYDAVMRTDPGRDTTRLSAAWSHVGGAVAGLNADGYVADPLRSEDYREAARTVQARRDAEATLAELAAAKLAAVSARQAARRAAEEARLREVDERRARYRAVPDSA